MNYRYSYDSPLGNITLASDGIALIGLWFDGQKYFADTLGQDSEATDLPIFAQTVKWLDTYFGGRCPKFTPPLAINTSPFRKEIWDVLRSIPYGKTMTYGEIVALIAKKRKLPRMSAQAVGGAVGHNPISLIIPCHRVVGANGNLTGYAGGIEKKRQLLEMEKASLFMKRSHD